MHQLNCIYEFQYVISYHTNTLFQLSCIKFHSFSDSLSIYSPVRRKTGTDGTKPLPTSSRHIRTITFMNNEEQIISVCPIGGAISVRVDGGVRKLSVVCLHNNAIVARCIMDTYTALWDTRTVSAPSILLVLLEPHCNIMVGEHKWYGHGCTGRSVAYVTDIKSFHIQTCATCQ